MQGSHAEVDRRVTLVVAVALAAFARTGVARAELADDGYCDYVEGTAQADSATKLAPQLFGQFGYIEQPAYAVTPGATNLRAIGGLRYRLTGIYEGLAMRDKAGADCRRHRALLQVKGASLARALAARVKVLDGALHEAEQILAEQETELDARRLTTQEATATRLRVDDLRALAEDAHRQLAALPPPDDRPLGATLTAFVTADANMEIAEGKLRKSQAYDVSVRVGVDRFLSGSNPSSQYFAVIEVGFNFGALWLGGGNDRAAAGRKIYVRSGHDPLGADQTVDQIRTMIDLESKRGEQAVALAADLDRQLQSLAKVPGEDSKRLRQTVWFEWVKANADVAYLHAHVTALHQVVDGETP